MVEPPRRLFVIIATLGTMLVGAPVGAQDDSARDLVRDAVRQSFQKPSLAKMRLAENGNERIFNVRRMLIDDTERVRINVKAPYQYSSLRYLFIGHYQHFMFVPSMNRTSRIHDDNLNQPFLATEFFIVDLVPPNLETWDHRFVGKETIGDRECRLVERTPARERGAAYGRMVLAIDPKDDVVVRTQFYDQAGELLKTWSIDELEKVDGVWTALEQRMIPVDGKTWHLAVEEIEYGTNDVTPEDFTVVNLN